MYKLEITFMYTTIFGKSALKFFRGGTAKRKLEKNKVKYEKKGKIVSYKIIDLEQDNIMWRIESNDLILLKDTEKELTTEVDKVLQQLTGIRLFETARKIKFMKLGDKIGTLVPTLNEKVIEEGKNPIILNFKYYKDNKKLSGV